MIHICVNSFVSHFFTHASSFGAVTDFRLATTVNRDADTDSLIKPFESTIRKFPNCAEGHALFGQVRAFASCEFKLFFCGLSWTACSGINHR